MLILVAQGPGPAEQWRRPLPPQGCVVLGREQDAWSVSWEPFLSRRHAELHVQGSTVRLRRLPQATNPIFHRGAEVEDVVLGVGECFVIGQTLFTLEGDSEILGEPAEPLPVQSHTITLEELEPVPFRDAPRRLDVLRRLPEVIRGAADERTGWACLVDLLLAGIRHAEAVAVVTPDTVVYWDRRRSGEGRFLPSRRLIQQAIREQRQTVLHLWSSASSPATASPSPTAYTLHGSFDWAFCTPFRQDTEPERGLYVAGRLETTSTPFSGNEQQLHEDIKFTELVVDIYGALRQVQQFRERQSLFRRFFSPAVLELLGSRAAEGALEPREADVTVLFCDLRGFSRTVESAEGNLLSALQRVSAALGIMTRAILRHGGVVADFLGDAALGFWGWPTPQPTRIRDAALAALDIHGELTTLARDESHILHGFCAGIGIASGRAVAGGIGTTEQVKVTVFGPPVNLAARLQDLTKLLRVPILLDETTATALRQGMDTGSLLRVRRLARLIPVGLTRPLTVAELLPAGPHAPLSDADLVTYEQALDAFLAGQWDEAYRLLHRIPPDDRGKDLLMEIILQHGRKPPPSWTGAIPILHKN
jgi:adenylate cyclase